MTRSRRTSTRNATSTSVRDRSKTYYFILRAERPASTFRTKPMVAHPAPTFQAIDLFRRALMEQSIKVHQILCSSNRLARKRDHSETVLPGASE